ncbi:TetR/AcrR family transcriptional regulator [Mycolicibacterium mengxianglii]|uniref:TetR/AcrR family transcriptional regulator n=1 Tax=Mycolicibacterium mengxianglii TaxID=2736649 RepID=UPI0018D050A2|nr:TetR/AcrR family transcriptional regulator C-terminal domain-containing protein [Mycolicibacterium mengxianglii]
MIDRSTTADAIYARAQELLDAEGLPGINARRLAAELRCSTKTLYLHVGSQEQLIRELVARHFAALRVEFEEADTWQSSALRWCQAVRHQLLAHPHLSELMTFDDRTAVISYVNRLLRILLEAGVRDQLARECCRVLVHTTISMTNAEIRSSSLAVKAGLPAQTPDIFDSAIRWIIAGVDAENRAAT